MEKLVYLNGAFVKENEAKVSIFDRGFIHGDAAFDAMRTYRHKPFRIKDYLDRFFRSMRYLQIESPLSKEEWEGVVYELLEKNLPLVGEDDEYTVMLRTTRGSSLQDILNCGPSNYMAVCKPVPLKSLAKGYKEGIHLVVPSRRRVPAESISPLAKTQSRVDLMLAELDAKRMDPNALPLLLDTNGNVAESSVMNFFMVQNGALLTPKGNCLNGVTRMTLLELAKDMGVEAREENFGIYDVHNAEETFLCSTTPVILPVAKVNNRPLGNGVPGPVTQRLFDAWSKLVGVDIVAQAERHAATPKS